MLRAENLAKYYKVYRKPVDRLAEWLMPWRGERHERFWALRELSFRVEPGRAFGVIGRNGAGKSTLLQLLGGTLEPSFGSVHTEGPVVSMLHLGVGFNPELSGRENVFQTCALMGIRRGEVKERYPGILAFADIGHHIEQPVKTYSSGMLLRLAFAINTSFRPAILLIDEVLAVGDIHFRQRCYDRLREMMARGTAVILVSHAMNEVEDFCQEAMVLDRARRVFSGTSVEAVKFFYHQEQAASREAATGAAGPGSAEVAEGDAGAPGFWPAAGAFLPAEGLRHRDTDAVRTLGVAICDAAGRPCLSFRQGEEVHFFHEYAVLRDIPAPCGGVGLRNSRGILVHGKDATQLGSVPPDPVRAGARLRYHQVITLDLAVDDYTVDLGMGALPAEAVERLPSMSCQEVQSAVLSLSETSGIGPLGVVLGDRPGATRLSHHGVADLPGRLEIRVVGGS